MSISLLYREDAAIKEAGSIGKNTLDQLALCQFARRLRVSDQDKEYFLRILSQPLTRKADITFRCEVLNCFVEQKELLDQLTKHFDRLYQLRSDYNDAKKERRQLLRTASQEAIPEAAKNLLQMSGLTLKRCLLLLEATARTLGAYSFQAEGMTALLTELRSITADDTFKEMCALCTHWEQYSEVTGTAVRLKVNAVGLLTACDLVDRRRIVFRKPEAKKRRILFAKKDDFENPPAAPINLTYCTLQAKLRGNAMIGLSELIDNMTGQLFHRFQQIHRELAFYRCAIKYVSMLREKGAPICYAQIGEEGQMRFSRLYDPLLVQACDTITQVIPNDLFLSTFSGLALFGENGSGKTVWLRSVGLLQLLTQAGLPIPAESAEVRLYKQIFTHFSASEKEFEAGNEAGRFEQEVREMASILDEIGDCGLLLLNETFQTTAYEEGAEGLAHILRYLAERGNSWMLTTHLTNLPRFFSSGELALYRTMEDHRVVPAGDG